MKDRNVQHASRFRLTKVPGTDDVYDLIPAPGEVYEEGTLINKSALLKDATAALFGLGADAVPDDVLAELGKYKQYWWRRRLPAGDWEYLQSSDRNESPDSTESNGYVVNVGNIISEKGSIAANDARTPIKYADAVIASQTGTLSLVSPSELTVSGTTVSKYNVLKGKYILLEDGATTGATSGFLPTGVYYIPDDAIFSISASSRRIVSVDKYAIVTAIPLIDGYEYEYLGIPLDNAVTAPRIETGSYIGTGTYGQANPNMLTFWFVPKLVFIAMGQSGYRGVCWVHGCTGMLGMETGNLSIVSSIGGNTLSWFSNSSDANQLNLSAKTYQYIAIG